MTTSRIKLRLFVTLIVFVAGAALLGLRPRHAAADGGVMLVASIGDSVASGEGVPTVPKWSGGPVWQDTTCHRSFRAGTALAFYAHIQPVFHNSYFKHVACSGAKIASGLLGPQYYDDHTVKVSTPQVVQVQNWLTGFGGRRLDALFVSVGANDAGFGEIVTHCMWVSSCENDATFVQQVQGQLADLDRQYDNLAAAIGLSLNPLKVFITEYPDPTRKDATQFCNAEPRGDYLDRITGDEAQWASQVVVATLNAKIRAAAQRHAGEGWQVVAAADAFVGHAYCGGAPWINTVTASNDVQGDNQGSVHPNYAGQSFYGNRLADAFFAVYPPPAGVPAAPSNLKDTLTLSVEREIHTLSWTINSTTQSQVVLTYQEAGATTWTSKTLAYNTTRYPLGTAFQIGHTYTFYVQACNPNGCSAPSNTIFVDL